jgi:hypothetical protein
MDRGTAASHKSIDTVVLDCPCGRFTRAVASDTSAKCVGCGSVIAIIKKGAYISEGGLYRYWLSRHWDNDKNTVGWIMVNPSTADATKDDATVRRCINFAKSWGYGGIIIVNLFAYRSKNPQDVWTCPVDPIGPDNNYQLRGAMKHCKIVVAAWGINGTYKNRDKEVKKFFPVLHCLGTTVTGNPRHPLYMPADTKPIIFK